MNGSVTAIASSTRPLGIGRMLTTMGPENGPDTLLQIEAILNLAASLNKSVVNVLDRLYF